MNQIDPDRLGVILATDCGSTTTKAILIRKIDGCYRQTHRGEAPTSVEEPLADVTLGVVNAVTEVGELAGRRLVGPDGLILRPARMPPGMAANVCPAQYVGSRNTHSKGPAVWGLCSTSAAVQWCDWG